MVQLQVTLYSQHNIHLWVSKLAAHTTTVVMATRLGVPICTTEENFNWIFKRSGADEYAGRSEKEKIALKRYGLGLSIDYLYEKMQMATPKK